MKKTFLFGLPLVNHQIVQIVGWELHIPIVWSYISRKVGYQHLKKIFFAWRQKISEALTLFQVKAELINLPVVVWKQQLFIPF